MSVIDWNTSEVRWALVRLLTTGELQHNRGNSALVAWLRQLNWLRQGPRRDLFLLNTDRRMAVEQRLADPWPDWQRELAELRDAGLPLDEAGLRELHRRSLPLRAVMPPRLHRKTWAARFGAHSKTGSPDRQPPESLTLTDDDLLRLRPNRGLRLRFADGGELDCTELARRFGDLDPEGIRIYESLVDPAGIKDTGRNPRPRLFLPPWWADYLDTHGLPTVGAWPSASVISSDSGLFAALRVKKAGLEQEAILLDPRLGAALEELL